MWKDKGLQLVMLSTKEKSLLWSHKGRTLRYNEANFNDVEDEERYYLYLLSDEKIKEGEVNTPSDFWDFSITNEEDLEIVNNKLNGYRKVIASTDPSLNLPKFPSSFLEEYVKRYNSKKSLEVEVEYESYWEDYHGRETDDESDFCYNLNRLKVNPDNTIPIRFKEEKMYSRSEVEALLILLAGELTDNECDVSDWIKENLK